MTLNGEMALILRYFTEFGSFLGALCKSTCQSPNYGQFTITLSSSKRLQRDRATLTVQIPSRFINSRLKLICSTCLAIVLVFDWYQNRLP